VVSDSGSELLQNPDESDLLGLLKRGLPEVEK
jgi:hypothetical protein